MNSIVMSICVSFLCGHMFSVLGCMLRNGIAMSYGNSMFNILSNCQIILQTGHTILLSHSHVSGLQFLHMSIPLCLIIFFCVIGFPRMFSDSWLYVLLYFGDHLAVVYTLEF